MLNAGPDLQSPDDTWLICNKFFAHI